jgi:hypothetical protein
MLEIYFYSLHNLVIRFFLPMLLHLISKLASKILRKVHKNQLKLMAGITAFMNRLACFTLWNKLKLHDCFTVYFLMLFLKGINYLLQKYHYSNHYHHSLIRHLLWENKMS